MPNPAPSAALSESKLHCANCGAQLLGPFCHECGQPLRSPVRELISVARESLGELFSLDGKFFRSLVPLYFLPGQLTREYFAGKRFSFMKPFRIYLGVSIAMLLLLSWITPNPSFEASDKGAASKAVPKADTEAAEAKAKQSAAPTERSQRTPEPSAGQAPSLQAKPKQDSSPVSSPDKDGSPPVKVKIGGEDFDPLNNPLRLTWAPAWFEAWCNQQLAILWQKGHSLERHPNRLLPSLWQNAPRAMFFLLPLFALFLKLLYLFKRRLYIEHLIVALHSHSFIFLSVILIIAWRALGEALSLSSAVIAPVTGLLAGWIPIYLLVMQKRVYRQGWIMTTLKYGIAGTCYVVLTAFTSVLVFVLAVRFLD